ncbi:amylo-alpha-1,6-glucosidase [Paractinoplanes atraurantiacus]|uniref:Trehalase n=1 Tax=Paractinoplanes atraurantiacus TaxID=1036182 RepID=A0A285GLK5_9ACTN|nr:trehalase family glycosidase [Actinoplanes atraurantiacus]SNY24084.1 Trehalase [Actinoplanes atraurantiacus]
MSPTFSVREIPFSYRGSWFNLSPVIAEKTYADDLHLVSHQTGLHPVLRLSVPGEITATASRLTWRASEGGRVEASYESPDTIRLRGTGLGMRIAAAAPGLTPFSGAYLYRDPVDGAHVFTVYETGRRYRITVLSGRISHEAGVETLGAGQRSLTLPGETPWEIAIEEYQTARRPYTAKSSFDQVVTDAAEAFSSFAAFAPRTPAAELAAYVLWSATVDPAGFLTRPAVLMSKHWMDKVWSWDHCFNAIALAAADPGLAWNQFLLPFDHQDPAGALPDSIAHSEVLYNFVKPPIHGWALDQIRRRLTVAPSADQLADVYHRLARWTDFWLDHRRTPGHHLPHYQHGNDSGWDNATTFDGGDRALETGDLAAYLILQLESLARLAAELGETADAGRWSRTAERIRSAMLAELWDGTRFVARGAATGTAHRSRSLLDLMPIVLGAGLPAETAGALSEGLRAHLTEYGLATEPVDAPEYRPDGYWRGPIWAPSTVLAEDGLRRAGHTGLADEIRRRFLVLCEQSGFAENFDAVSGAGLRDRAYTWTASAYLILAA